MYLILLTEWHSSPFPHLRDPYCGWGVAWQEGNATMRTALSSGRKPGLESWLCHLPLYQLKALSNLTLAYKMIMRMVPISLGCLWKLKWVWLSTWHIQSMQYMRSGGGGANPCPCPLFWMYSECSQFYESDTIYNTDYIIWPAEYPVVKHVNISAIQWMVSLSRVNKD
jgi:hypothetical protein